MATDTLASKQAELVSEREQLATITAQAEAARVRGTDKDVIRALNQRRKSQLSKIASTQRRIRQLERQRDVEQTRTKAKARSVEKTLAEEQKLREGKPARITDVQFTRDRLRAERLPKEAAPKGLPVSEQFFSLQEQRRGDIQATRAQLAGGAAVSRPVSSELGEGVDITPGYNIITPLDPETVSSQERLIRNRPGVTVVDVARESPSGFLSKTEVIKRDLLEAERIGFGKTIAPSAAGMFAAAERLQERADESVGTLSRGGFLITSTAAEVLGTGQQIIARPVQTLVKEPVVAAALFGEAARRKGFAATLGSAGKSILDAGGKNPFTATTTTFFVAEGLRFGGQGGVTVTRQLAKDFGPPLSAAIRSPAFMVTGAVTRGGRRLSPKSKPQIRKESLGQVKNSNLIAADATSSLTKSGKARKGRTYEEFVKIGGADLVKKTVSVNPVSKSGAGKVYDVNIAATVPSTGELLVSKQFKAITAGGASKTTGGKGFSKPPSQVSPPKGFDFSKIADDGALALVLQKQNKQNLLLLQQKSAQPKPLKKEPLRRFTTGPSGQTTTGAFPQSLETASGNIPQSFFTPRGTRPLSKRELRFQERKAALRERGLKRLERQEFRFQQAEVEAPGATTDFFAGLDDVLTAQRLRSRQTKFMSGVGTASSELLAASSRLGARTGAASLFDTSSDVATRSAVNTSQAQASSSDVASVQDNFFGGIGEFIGGGGGGGGGRGITSPSTKSPSPFVATSSFALSKFVSRPSRAPKRGTPRRAAPVDFPDLDSSQLFGRRPRTRKRSTKKLKFAPSLTGLELGLKATSRSPVVSPFKIRGI